jgi:hypothetical protein
LSACGTGVVHPAATSANTMADEELKNRFIKITRLEGHPCRFHIRCQAEHKPCSRGAAARRNHELRTTGEPGCKRLNYQDGSEGHIASSRNGHVGRQTKGHNIFVKWPKTKRAAWGTRPVDFRSLWGNDRIRRRQVRPCGRP